MALRSVGRALALVALWAAVAQAQALVYLSRDGIELRPGKSNSHLGTTSLVTKAATVAPWDVSEDMWAQTVACLEEIYAPFDVTFTEDEPGDVPYMRAVFGGSPKDLDLPRYYTGVSPFASDCGVIDRSIVFAFTEVLPPDPTAVCHVIAQELGHSFGLDHVLAPSDPMSTAHAPGPRAFVDADVACGEDTPRPCGLPKASCRPVQNSFALLAERIGLAPDPHDPLARQEGEEGTGCNAGRGGGGGALLALAALARRLTSRGRT